MSKSKKKSRMVEKYSDPVHQMNSMMGSNFHTNIHNVVTSMLGGSPFGMLEGPGGMQDQHGFGMRPSGDLSMRAMIHNMANSSNFHTVSQSSFVSMSSGPNGQRQVYQASSTMRQAPGGVKETTRQVSDSRSCIKKVEVGHHIGDRSHIIQREKNFRSGDAEEREEFINLDQDEAEVFNREWQSKMGRGHNAIGYNERRRSHHHPQHGHSPMLALPSSSAAPAPKGRDMKKKRAHEYDAENSQNYRKKNFKKSSQAGRSAEPIPLVEEPDSDDDVVEITPRSTAPPPTTTTIIEELE